MLCVKARAQMAMLRGGYHLLGGESPVFSNILDHLAGEALEDALSRLSVFWCEATFCERVHNIFVFAPRIEQGLDMEPAPSARCQLELTDM